MDEKEPCRECLKAQAMLQLASEATKRRLIDWTNNEVKALFNEIDKYLEEKGVKEESPEKEEKGEEPKTEETFTQDSFYAEYDLNRMAWCVYKRVDEMSGRFMWECQSEEGAKTLAREVNNGAVTCRGCPILRSNCGQCIKCRLSI